MFAKNFLNGILITVLAVGLVSCAGGPTGGEDEFDSGDDISEDKSADNNDSDSKGEDVADSTNGDEDLEGLEKDLEKEQKVAAGTDKTKEDDLEDPLSKEAKSDQKANAEETNNPKSDNTSEVVSEATTEPPPPPPQETTPESTESASVDSNQAPSSGAVDITNIKFEANEGAGSIVIEGTQAFDFSSRLNSQSNQYVIEIKNARLPKKLQRPYITKDFPTAIGSIDAYQTPGTDLVQVVVQLREGAGEPTSHAEGNSIIVVPAGGAPAETVIAESPSATEAFPADTKGVSILSSYNLEQFLSGNMKYYGKKISIEVKDIEVRSAINLIAEESGANLVMSDGVNGNLALKLKNVPWDQALALILKAKNLGYTRQGNVLRISPMDEIKKEEEDALKMVESRRKVEPLKVQMIPINFADLGALPGQLKSVLSERGSVVADPRTRSLIVTETTEVLERAKKIIASLDIAPAQVLIEGKLVEARESFNKKLGINWEISGMPVSLGDGTNGPVNLIPNLSIRPGAATGGSLGFNLSLGTLDVLGDLTAVLALEEQEENVRVISSPRIVTLNDEPAAITQSASVPVLASQGKDGTKSYKDLNLKMDLRVTPSIANNGVVQLKVDITREFLGAVRDDGSAGSHNRTASTKVMVKSGQTAVIGGIYQNDSSQLEAGVPFFKDIPILGFLFRGRTFHKDKTELLLFLTPRILSQAGSPLVAEEMGEKDMSSSKKDVDVE